MDEHVDALVKMKPLTCRKERSRIRTFRAHVLSWARVRSVQETLPIPGGATRVLRVVLRSTNLYAKQALMNCVPGMGGGEPPGCGGGDAWMIHSYLKRARASRVFDEIASTQVGSKHIDCAASI